MRYYDGMDFGDKTCEVMLSEEALARRTREIGADITREFAGRGHDLVIVGVMKGSVVFLADLMRAIDLPVRMELIGIASYGDDTESSGVVQITADLSAPIAGKDVIIVEDIIDTGLTMKYLLENFETRHPRTLKVCSLLHKPDRTKVNVPVDYLGFTIPDDFVVGYGLDHAQRYRNLPFIGVLK